jgi:DNA polymerase (family X)
LKNADVAAALHEIADLLEIKGEDRFRYLAYRRAAEAISSTGKPVADMRPDELVGINGVGKGMAARVKEFCESGRMESLDKLRAQVPIGLREMTLIPGLGPKKAMQLYQALGVSNVEELREAAESKKISEVKGFGPRFEEEVLAAISRGVRAEQRLLLARALPAAQEMVQQLKKIDVVERVAFAGSLRRMKDTIGDIDILVGSRDPEAAAAAFKSMHGVVRAEAEGPTKTTIVSTTGLQIDLRVVDPSCFGAALQYFTGSKAHNVKIRERAVRMGLKVSEYGVHRVEDDSLVCSETEEELYASLGLKWMPPTMREDLGEIEASLADALPDVVTLDQIRGDLQSHSTYSDGRLSVREMAFAAADRGYEYYAITDHGRRLTYMKNLGPREIEAQREEVAAINDELVAAGRKLRVLHGVELNIDADGTLDYDDKVLASFDLCVASIHSSFKASKRDQTKRLIRAIENPHVHVIGHPSGRRLDRREGIDFDVEAVAKAAAKHGVAMEINAHPYRLDLRDDHVRWARETGCYFVISTDAHSAAELDNMHFGVATAQRGWCEAERVINTWPRARLEAFLAK